MKPKEIRDLIAESIWKNLSADDVEDFCIRLGMRRADEGEHPFNSKRKYVHSRVKNLDLSELKEVARKILEEWEDSDLETVFAGEGARGVDGTMQNLIFAARGPKPRIVLRDAINNVVEVVENSANCLFYDRPLSPNGLSWSDLTAWWKSVLHTDLNDREVALNLWERLNESLQSEVEKLLFRSYATRYGKHGFMLPALIPQVYLHYDPYSSSNTRGGNLVRQRMDFLLLLPNRVRVVIEVDGRHHYADSDGKASPLRYGEMVSEDRKLRLAGYEVYRFGGLELMRDDASDLLTEFFDHLLRQNGYPAQ